MDLYEAVAPRVDAWRNAGYPCAYPAIREILDFAIEGEQAGLPFPASGSLRFLRAAQLRALETYWYLRLVERTPHVEDLYARLFEDPTERLAALGLTGETFLKMALQAGGVEGLISRIKGDEAFAAEHRLDALRETLTLAYPSYILALAMGAGKTILIGAIVATEFAMALEYPESGDGEDSIQFIENALVFAPGKTIIESLRELARIQYEKILPPRLFKPFDAALKLTFTRDGEKDIPVIRGSSFNLVVTNTEKIRIQARPVRKTGGGLVQLAAFERAEEEANLRLQAIASLPHLGIFSDEAHHTYGQSLGKELKRVRQTVDYLKENSPNLICIVNTTGTPYFEHQPLRDVVVWYGLSQGIKDGILKEVAGHIEAWNVGPEQAPDFVRHAVTDFFADYGHVSLPDGSPAKLALYFPQTDDLEELRPCVEMALAEVGQSPNLVLAHTSKSGAETLDAFNRLNDPSAPHRVILLVNIGTEGWNCPSLFATALARKLSSSNNFVLQAASRCLRQVPGNAEPARIYLSIDNRAVLDKQLQETYGETISDLDTTRRATRRDLIVLTQAKLPIPPLLLKQTRRTLRRVSKDVDGLALTAPAASDGPPLTGTVLDIGAQIATRSLLRAVGDALTIDAPPRTVDLYAVATELAGNFHVPTLAVLRALRAAYSGVGEIPRSHLSDLGRQIERQVAEYDEVQTEELVSVEIVKPDGFDPEPQPDGGIRYSAEISYPADHARYVVGPSHVAKDNRAGYGFHYIPYNFDSGPEVSYFEQLLQALDARPTEVEDVYFIGGLTDPAKTDLLFEYRTDDGKTRAYTPDFLLRCKDGRALLVEIKREKARRDPVEGEQGLKARAVRAVVARNPGLLDYGMEFATGDSMLTSDLKAARGFAENCGPAVSA